MKMKTKQDDEANLTDDEVLALEEMETADAPDEDVDTGLVLDKEHGSLFVADFYTEDGTWTGNQQ